MNRPEKTASANRSKVQTMTNVAVMTAVTCVLAPLAIPIGPVPISLTTFVILISVYLLGWKLGTLSCFVYLLLGMFGAPVFSGFAGGMGKLMGPTGGYLIGFLPMAAICGLAIERFSRRSLQFAGMVLGTLVCYLLGTAWLCHVANMEVIPALSVAVFPFIPGDIVKIVLAMLTGPVLCDRLARAGLPVRS